MGSFFSGLCGWLPFSKWLNDEVKSEDFNDTAARGKIYLISSWGQPRPFYFYFSDFASVDGRAWTPAACEKFLGLKVQNPTRVFVIYSRGKFLFFCWHKFGWVVRRMRNISHSEVQNFLFCPRNHHILPTVFAKSLAKRLQYDIEHGVCDQQALPLLGVQNRGEG